MLKHVQNFIRIKEVNQHVHAPFARIYISLVPSSHHDKVLHETLVCSFVEVLTLSCEPEEQVYILSSIFRPHIGLQLNKYDCCQR